MAEQYAIEMLNITKRFPGIIANDNITLQLRRGEIHALLGENGAGKSTLMSVLFGLYQPEEGEIKKDGQVVQIRDPLFILCCCALLLVLTTRTTEKTPYHDIQIEASNLMKDCEDFLYSYIIANNIPIETEDLNRTGLIGPAYTPLMTTMGDIAAKRTSLDPL